MRLRSTFLTARLTARERPADRYIALQNNAQGEGPLKEYFKGETLHHSVDACVDRVSSAHERTELT